MNLSRKSYQFLSGFSLVALVTSGCAPVGSPFETLARGPSSQSSIDLDSYIAPTPRPSNSSNTRVCESSSAPVQGIDVSAWNPSIDWPRVKRAGKDFVFIKATEGASYVSPTFEGDWAEAKSAGLLRGAYHFFRPSADPVEQAENFLETMGNLDEYDLPPMLDWEATDSVSPAVQIQRAKTWLLIVEKATGKIPVLYTGPSFWNQLGNPQDFIRYALFVANYQVSCPWVPAPWSKWAFWQMGDDGIVDGSSTDLDVDVFNGTLEELKRFARFGFL